MRAIGLNQYGGPEVLEVVELPDPQVGHGQLLIRVHAAAVNPTDTLLRSGARRNLPSSGPPYVPGMDVGGILEAIGPGVATDLTVGDPVMAIVVPDGSHGGYSERLALPVGSVAAAPAGASLAEASTLPMNGLTARQALDLLALSSGQTLAVTGAAGAVGGYVIQLAKADGLRVIADASEGDEQLVRSFGADVIVHRGDDVAARIREEVPHGVDGLVDTALQYELVFPAVKDGGGVATVRGWNGQPPRGISLHQVMVRRYADDHARLNRLREQTEDGTLTLRVAQSFPAHQAPEAHRILEGGGVRGRLILEF